MEKAPNNTPPSWERPTIGESLQQLWSGIKNWFIEFADLKEGMDRDGTIIAIKSGKLMQGSNAWMLICSIMIASLGLDLNSEAVIIGAMLISPLMSPILGIGLGMSTNDRETLFMAVKHFGISILIALISSTLYFKLTPLGTFTDMIEARTAPTLLDGLIAIFGGLAGIISITRKDKSNAIPGVAIATALMPPLCVTGYGIANGNPEIALNSFYLFFLNSFFIAITSYLIIRFLNFPYKIHPDQRAARQARIVIILFSLILIIPGFIILRDVIKNTSEKQSIRTFVENEFGISCIDYTIMEVSPDSNILVVQLINRELSDSLINTYNLLLKDKYQLSNTYFQAMSDYGGKLADLEKRAIASNELNKLNSELAQISARQKESARQDSLHKIKLLQSPPLDSLQLARLTGTIKLADQLQFLDTLYFGQDRVTDLKSGSYALPHFLVHWNNRPNLRLRKQQDDDLDAFLKNYFTTHNIAIDTVIIHSY
jgi:uncharacterized hydrophobic protein (TIGR00271 family)